MCENNGMVLWLDPKPTPWTYGNSCFIGLVKVRLQEVQLNHLPYPIKPYWFNIKTLKDAIYLLLVGGGVPEFGQILFLLNSQRYQHYSADVLTERTRRSNIKKTGQMVITAKFFCYHWKSLSTWKFLCDDINFTSFFWLLSGLAWRIAVPVAS